MNIIEQAAENVHAASKCRIAVDNLYLNATRANVASSSNAVTDAYTAYNCAWKLYLSLLAAEANNTNNAQLAAQANKQYEKLFECEWKR